MSIETLDDWNTRLVNGCCGCEMPECELPYVVCEVKSATLDEVDTQADITYDDDGDLFAGDPIESPTWQPKYTGPATAGDECGTMYRKETRTYSELTRDVEEGEGILPDTIECTDTTKVITTYTYNGDGTVTVITNTYVLSEPLTKVEFIALVQADMDADTWATGTCESVRQILWATYPVGWTACIAGTDTYTADGLLTKLRFRFRVSDAHTGSYFKFTYDIGEFPDVGDPVFVSVDNVVEWTGPGTGASDDPSWLTDWIELDHPEEDGARRVVNLRYTCYHGTKYGVKPQVTGEALEVEPSALNFNDSGNSQLAPLIF